MTWRDVNAPQAGAADATGTDADDTSQDQGSDYEQLLEQSQAANAELAKRVENAEAAADARMRQLEGMVQASFNRQPQPEPEPEPDPLSQVDPESLNDLSPAQLLQLGAQLNERKSRQMIQENNRRMATGLKGVFDHTYAQTVESLKTREPDLYEMVQQEFEEHFEKNPSDKYVSGRVQQKFDELVGKNYGKIRQKVAEAQVEPVPAPATRQAAPSGGPRPASPGSPPAPVSEEPQLSPAELHYAQKFGMTAEEYVKWQKMEDAGLLPERRG
jgi:hypothetical protein